MTANDESAGAEGANTAVGGEDSAVGRGQTGADRDDRAFGTAAPEWADGEAKDSERFRRDGLARQARRAARPFEDRAGLEHRALSLMYDLFLIQRPESWGPADAAGLSPLQVAISTVITETRRPLCISDIARRLGCSRQTISRSVANLEEKCFVLRRPARRDGRRVIVCPQPYAKLAAEWARQWEHVLPGSVELTPKPGLRAVVGCLEAVLKQARLVDRSTRRR